MGQCPHPLPSTSTAAPANIGAHSGPHQALESEIGLIQLQTCQGGGRKPSFPENEERVFWPFSEPRGRVFNFWG